MNPRILMMAVLGGALAIGCASPGATAAPRARSSIARRAGSASVATANLELDAKVTPPSTRTVVFLADASCAALQRTEVELSEHAPAVALKHILESAPLASLSLDAADVHVEAGAARVDLKLPTGSTRDLRALSKCEQLALLSAMTHTLKANPKWGIQ